MIWLVEWLTSVSSYFYWVIFTTIILFKRKYLFYFLRFQFSKKNMFNPCNSWRRCHCDCMAFSLWSHGDRGVHTELALMALSRSFHYVHRVVTTRSLRVHCAFTELTLRWRRFVWHSEVIETADRVLISQALLDGTHQSLFPKPKSCIFQAGINNTTHYYNINTSETDIWYVSS